MTMNNSLFDLKPSTQKSDSDNAFIKKKRKAELRDINKLAENFIKDHSEKNFNALMKRCNWGLRSFIYNITQNDEDTDNIMSITMEHVYFRIDTFNADIAKFSTWMYKIAYNNTLRYLNSGGLRSKIDIVPVDISELCDSCSSSEDDERDSSISALCDEEVENMYFDGKEFLTYTKDQIFSDIYDASVECMEYLPDKLRIVMKERYIDQKKVAQIASDNNIAQSSVKNWIRKGIVCLGEEIRARHPELCDLYEESMIEK